VRLLSRLALLRYTAMHARLCYTIVSLDALAFTRSIGDFHLQSYGVSHVPDVLSLDLTNVFQRPQPDCAPPAPLMQNGCCTPLHSHSQHTAACSTDGTPMPTPASTPAPALQQQQQQYHCNGTTAAAAAAAAAGAVPCMDSSGSSSGACAGACGGAMATAVASAAVADEMVSCIVACSDGIWDNWGWREVGSYFLEPARVAQVNQYIQHHCLYRGLQHAAHEVLACQGVVR
jgi:hypothetical protein